MTLFGESAGGEAISALLLVDEAKPYFHKAIIESNCFGSFYTVDEEREICRKYLELSLIHIWLQRRILRYCDDPGSRWGRFNGQCG